MDKLTMAQLQRPTLADSLAQPRMPLVLVLEDIRSMHNVGSIFRTADAFRVEALYLCGFTGRPPHREIHKAALGAEDSVPWIGAETSLEAIAALRARGYQICALEQTSRPTWLHTWRPSPAQPVAILLGNEVEGLSAQALAASDIALEIAQAGIKHSLNVSVAASLAIYQVWSGWQ